MIIDEAKDYSKLISPERKKIAEQWADYVFDQIVRDITAGKDVDLAQVKATHKRIMKDRGGWIDGNDVAGYFLQVLNDKLAKAGIGHKLKRKTKINNIYKNIDNLSPEEFKEAFIYLQKHVIGIKFGIPKANSVDAIINRLTNKYTDKPLEWIDDKAEKLFAAFNNYESEFKLIFPDAQEGRDYWYRRVENPKDTDPHVDLWRMMAETKFDENISNAPASVIKMMEIAQSKSANEAKDIEDVKAGNIFNSYYFALAVLKMFDDDLHFYTAKTKSGKVLDKEDEFDADAVADSDEVFKQDFDDIDAYGDKKESLTEGKEDKYICCICGEECIGYGNNPAPVKDEGRCCDACNFHFVIPARLALMNSEEK